MAKAKINPAKTRTEVIEIEPETVTLTLSKDEALVVRALTAHTADGVDEPFGMAVRGIYEALRSVGVESFNVVEVRTAADEKYSPVLYLRKKA